MRCQFFIKKASRLLPDIAYERIVAEVKNGTSQYLITCLFDDDFDIHHRYTDEVEYEGEFNLLQLVAYYMSIEKRPSEYFLIIEKLLSKGLNLSDLPDDANARCFSYLCGSNHELPVALIDFLVQHGAVINPPLLDGGVHIITPLFEAASVLNLQTMRKLCELGVYVNPDVGTNDWDSAFAPCLEFAGNGDATHIQIYNALLLLLEFNFKIPSDNFITICDFVEDNEINRGMQLRCVNACLNIPLTDRKTKPFFIANSEVEGLVNSLQDGNLIKQAIQHAQNVYDDWQKKILERHDSLRIIHSFFTLHEYEQVELANANEHFEDELVFANRGLS